MSLRHGLRVPLKSELLAGIHQDSVSNLFSIGLEPLQIR